MSLLRYAIRSNSSLPHHRLPFFLRVSPKQFSTEAQQPPSPSPPPQQNPSPDSFLQDPDTGLVYAKLLGTNKHTFKTDVINLLEGCNLTSDDVKIGYNRAYFPVSVMIQFHSHQAFANGVNAVRKARLYRLERADRSEWDYLMPHEGKTILMQGFSQNAIPEDVERFLSGCDYDPSSIQMYLRQSFDGRPSTKNAVVRFSSRTAAMNAFITRNKDFCLNNQILLRVLE